ncbi:MAG TPA: hypothetical protein PLQ93_09700 [Bacteroidia bacterium]|nr:hypothetical protein [Bacteroidia bacterium]
MKKLLLLLSAASILGSSCSSKFGLAKRRYTKGYYVSVSHQPESSGQRKQNHDRNLMNPKSGPEEVKTVRVLPQTQTPGLLPSEQKTSASVNHIVRHDAKASKGLATASHLTNQTGLSAKQSIRPLALPMIKGSGNKADDTLTTILLVILCLFWWLNLVAVYLHQGKKITKDFWITLILDLTVIGGIVYAILVVLDVLSFA